MIKKKGRDREWSHANPPLSRRVSAGVNTTSMNILKQHRGRSANLGSRIVRVAMVLVTLSATFASPLNASAAIPEGDLAQVGEVVPDFEFRKLVGHDGRSRLSQLVGQPVLVAGWRPNFNDGVYGLEEPIKLLKKHGAKGLVVVLEDRNRWLTDDMWADSRSFHISKLKGLERAWLSNNPDTDRSEDLPIQRTHGRTLKSLVLFGVDGTLVLEGEADDVAKKLGPLIKGELDRAKKGWGENSDVKAARALAFGKGKLSGARAALEALDPSEDRDLALEQVNRRFDALSASVQHLLSAGRPTDAMETFEGLENAAKGAGDWAAALVDLDEALSADPVRTELNQDKKLRSMLKPLWNGGKADPKLLGKLHRFSKAVGDSRVGERARRIQQVVRSNVLVTYGAKAVEEATGGR